jgi:ribosomal protein S18 acetylase RimI-like enzyme
MPELKKIRIREAQPRDVGLFKKLWMKLLESQHEAGSPILPNEHNLEVAVGLFNMYVDADRPDEFRKDGVVLFVSDAAVLMWGDMCLPYQVSIGDKVAYGWGHYVDPEYRGKGIMDKMLDETLERLKSMGFDAILGSTMDGDDHADEALRRGIKQRGDIHLTGERPCYVLFKE